MRLPKSTPQAIPTARPTPRLNSRISLVLTGVAIVAILASAAVSEASGGSDHGGGEHAEGGEKPKVKAQEKTCRWTEHESRLTSLTAKIRGLEKEIADMIHAKHHVESSEKVRDITQQIVFKYSDLVKVVRDYEAERLHVRFQHPDRDLEGERKYSAVRLKTLEEIEEAFGIDGRLDRIKRQVVLVFPAAKEEEEAKVRLPASVNSDEDDKPERIRLSK